MENGLDFCQLAIIVPVVNCLDYTKQFVNSIQTDRDFRLIVIDNGSSDGTQAYFQSLKHDHRVKYIRHDENIGVAPAWNEGIKKATILYGSEYFLICNNDIILHKDTIETLLNDLQDKTHTMCTPTNINNGINNPENINEYQDKNPRRFIETPDFSCFMIKQETIEKIGDFDPNFYPAYFEDNDYHYRIKLAGLHAVQDSQCWHYHFGSQTTKNNEATRNLSNVNYLKNRDYFDKKWGGYPGHETFIKPFNE